MCWVGLAGGRLGAAKMFLRALIFLHYERVVATIKKSKIFPHRFFYGGLKEYLAYFPNAKSCLRKGGKI
jgi:hypothetical protein